MKVLMKVCLVVVLLAMVTNSASAGMLWSGDPFLRGVDSITVDGFELETDYNLKMAEVGANPILDGLGDPVLDGDGNPTFTTADNVSLSLTNGGSLTTGNHLYVGYGQDDPVDTARLSSPESGGTATFTMEAGTTLTTGQDLEVTYFAGTTGIANLAGTINIGDDFRVGGNDHNTTTSVGVAIMNDATMTVNDDFEVGRYGDGTLTLNGSSSIDSGDDLKIGQDTGGIGVVTLNGDSMITINDDVQVGKHGTGTINISGNAVLDIPNDDLELGQLSGGIGTLYMSGGTINIGDDFELSKANADDFGTSYVYMSGGLITINDDMKLAQKGGTATVVITAGLIEVGDSLRITHEGQPGTTATLVLGDGSAPDALFGAATIIADDLNMNNAGNDGVIALIDFQPGGLLQLNGDVMGYIQEKIDGGYIRTTYAGLIDGSAAAVGYDFGITQADMTSVYLVPEPATLLLFGLGGLVLRRKKRVS